MLKQVIVLRNDLEMSPGKAAAQAAHASLGAYLRATKTSGYKLEALEWLNESQVKVILGVDSEEKLVNLENKVLNSGLPYKAVIDEGRTEFGGLSTYTAIAIGPAKTEDIDRITKRLRLY